MLESHILKYVAVNFYQLKIKNIFIVFLVGCSMLSILFSFNFSSLIYAKNNVNMYSKLIGYDPIQFPVTINISNTPINTHNTTITSSNSNFEVKDTANEIFNVTLDVFSGRPNPAWTLTKEQTLLFLNKISEIKPTAENIQSYPEKILGYRGFIVDQITNKNLTSKKFEIYNGVVKVLSNSSAYFLNDNNFQLEKWLLQTAYNHIDNSTFNFVKWDIMNRKLVN
jgi:hypothetical protein